MMRIPMAIANVGQTAKNIVKWQMRIEKSVPSLREHEESTKVPTPGLLASSSGVGSQPQGAGAQAAGGAAAPKPEPPTKLGLRVKRTVPLSETRRVIGNRLTSSLQTSAQVTHMFEADASEMMKLREILLPEIQSKTGERLTYTDILTKVVARALREFEMVNSTLEESGIRLIDEVNVGVAVASDRGLIVPVVRNADTVDLRTLVLTIKDIVKRAREGKLTIKDVGGGTFTLSNLGMTAVDGFTPIVNPPQTAILGVGRIVKKPVVVDDNIVIRPRVTLSLTFDHRVLDGFTASEFLRRIVGIMEDGQLLAETAK